MHPSTDPIIAMAAYSGMRPGRWMLNSISNKSLITGNVKIEESRKEIRNSPGAPSAPANPTIFCFQPLSGAAKYNSSVDSDVQCSRRPLECASEQRLDRFHNHVIHTMQFLRLDHVRR